MKKKVQDIIVILLSLVAIISLVWIFIASRANREETENKLDEMGQELNQNTLSDSMDKSGIIISEVNQEGWIELFNADNKEISLEGIEIEYKGKVLYTCGEETIGEREYSVIELGQKIGIEENTILAIKQSDGTYLEHWILPALQSGESYGLSSIAGYEKTMLRKTKGEENIIADSVTKEKLSFSAPSGFYPESFYLSIETSADDYIVYYTTDGTIPSVDSTVYSEPIYIFNRSGSNYVYASMGDSTYRPETINMGTIIRAIAVDRSGNIVAEESQSYFIGMSKNSDYVNMPVLSITINGDDLFDYMDGIYVAGRSYADDIIADGSGDFAGNYYNNWKKDAYIEFYESDKCKTFEGDLQLGIYIDQATKQGQKSFILSGDIQASEGSTMEKFLQGKGFILSNGNRDSVYKVRNFIAQKLSQSSLVPMSDVEPCAVFVNGEYWGCYMMHSPYNQAFFKENYNVNSVTLLSQNWQLYEYEDSDKFDSFVAYVINHDMSDEVNYQYVCEQMDIKNYLEYICYNMYLANADYDYSYQATVWRSTDGNGQYADGKWRWLLGDLGYSMAIKEPITVSTSDSFLLTHVTQDAFFQSLLMNESFCSDLEFTMETMLETYFTDEKIEYVMTTTKELMEKQILATYKRFRGETVDTFCATELQKIQDFFANRKEYILIYTKEIAEQGGSMEVILEARGNQLSRMENDFTDYPETITVNQ